MSTLFIGDLHLMSGLILPMIDQYTSALQINRIVLTGDYTDQWNQQDNPYLYQKDLEFLVSWKKEKEAKGIQVTCLVGNHDIPYLLEMPAHYSLDDDAGCKRVRELLLSLELQIACQVDGYLVSHGGYLGDNQLESWHTETLTDEQIHSLFSELKKMGYHNVGSCRGGRLPYGSPLWADAVEEFPRYPSKYYPKQIVGHRPLKEVTTFHSGDTEIIGIDTFTVSRIGIWPHYFPNASHPGCLLVDGETNKIITTPKWLLEGIGDKIIRYFTT